MPSTQQKKGKQCWKSEYLTIGGGCWCLTCVVIRYVWFFFFFFFASVGSFLISFLISSFLISSFKYFLHHCSMPQLQSAVDIAKMKMEKAEQDSEAEHQSAEDGMKYTKEYCDKVLVYEGDVTLATHGLQELNDDKQTKWSEHNATTAELENRRKEEVQRKVQLATLEVELHRKLTYLQRGCPTDSFSDTLPSATAEKLPSSTRCTECSGVTTMEDVRYPGLFSPSINQQAGSTQYKYTPEGPKRMYCAWKEKSCWEIDFLTGKCEPPPGLPSKCYRTNLLDPEVEKAVAAYQATKQHENMEEDKRKEEEVLKVQTKNATNMIQQ